jgi:hypothetical protein
MIYINIPNVISMVFFIKIWTITSILRGSCFISIHGQESAFWWLQKVEFSSFSGQTM